MLDSPQSVITESAARVIHNNRLALASSGTTTGILPNLRKAACASTKTIRTRLFHEPAQATQ